MRLRRNWPGEAELPDMPGVIKADPASFRNDPALSLNDVPIQIEIGSGKGDFIIAMASKHPRVSFFGIEKAPTVMYIAARKNQKRPLPNLRFLSVDARELDLFFGGGRAERIYLNFSDPWPKNRHEPRRLTSAGMLKVYREILTPGGNLQLKTDQESFFDYSLKMLIHEGWSVGKMTKDLHRSADEANIITEYEHRFLLLGQPIYRLEAWT